MSSIMKAGDFFRCPDGPLGWQFGRCRQSDDEWLVVEFFGSRYGPERQWPARGYRVSYPINFAKAAANQFLQFAEVWP